VLRLDNLRLRRRATQAIAWLLMALLPLEGMAAGALGVRGPLHTHRVDARTIVLEDLRRMSVAPRPLHVAVALGHFHADAAPLRHFHHPGDGSVVSLDEGGLGQAGDAGSAAADHAASALAGLLPAAATWDVAEVGRVRAFHVAWPCLSFEPEPFERPPRPG
jgi:hypothetical protein